jgi:hypothetical protein
MGTWLRIVGPGIALLLVSAALSKTPATKDLATLIGSVAVLYLLFAAPIYKRHWKARRRAEQWFLTERAKEPYKRRLSRTRQS